MDIPELKKKIEEHEELYSLLKEKTDSKEIALLKEKISKLINIIKKEMGE